MMEYLQMSSNFARIVEDVKKLSYDDKEELKFLLDKYLIDERREEIYRSYNESLRDMKRGDLEFSDDINDLRKMLG